MTDARPSSAIVRRPFYSDGMTTTSRPPKLSDLPLWRLIVLLDDLERTVGPASQTARTVARIIRERMADLRARQKADRNAD